ncbi:MAG TPA: helix-turn-helix transcriptional regulator [Candidatus Baltobacteraceae bacterium]
MADRLRERIARARDQAGVSQTELAAKLGLDNTAVSKIEQGKRAVSSVELASIAEYCGRPISWFFGDREGAEPHFRGAGVTSASTRAEVTWLAEFADMYCFLEDALKEQSAVS